MYNTVIQGVRKAAWPHSPNAFSWVFPPVNHLAASFSEF